MNDSYFFTSYKFLGDDVMGSLTYPKFLSSWILGFLPYHAKWDELLSNALCILNLWTSSDVSSAHHHFFACWLMSIRPVLTILCVLLLCLSFFLLRQYSSPPVVSVEFFILSTIKFVKSVEFYKAPYSLTLIRLHGCCSFFSVVRMKKMMRTWDLLDVVGNTHSIIVSAHTTEIMEVKTWMEVAL